jgi:hypothetical protein
VPLHIRAAATEAYPLRFQPKPLLNGGITTQFDLTSRAQDTLPGEPERTMKRPGDLTSCSRKARGSGNGAVG